MNILFFGTSDFAVSIPEAIYKAPGLKLVGAVTTPDQPVGRKQILTSSPVKQWAEEKQIPVLTPSKFDSNLELQISDLQPDLFVVAAYGKIIPQKILNMPKYGSLGVHPSLLPKYRGASPVQGAILNGEKETGVTIFKMDEKMDNGPIIFQFKEEINQDDTAEDLYNELFKKAGEKLPEILVDYQEGKIRLEEQKHEDATFTPILRKEMTFVNLESLPKKEELDRMIRAYYPWPGVWTKWEGKIIKFYPKGIVQIEGKKPINVKEFLNGYPQLKEFLGFLI